PVTTFTLRQCRRALALSQSSFAAQLGVPLEITARGTLDGDRLGPTFSPGPMSSRFVPNYVTTVSRAHLIGVRPITPTPWASRNRSCRTAGARWKWVTNLCGRSSYERRIWLRTGSGSCYWRGLALRPLAEERSVSPRT